MKHWRRGGTRSNSRAQLLRLMSPRGGARISLEGSNVGSAMVVRRAGDGRSSIHVYVSNNIQGVNNSILVGSSVHMGSPGVQFSLGDWMKKANGAGCTFFGFLLCVAVAIAIAIAVLLFFVTRRNKPS